MFIAKCYADGKTQTPTAVRVDSTFCATLPTIRSTANSVDIQQPFGYAHDSTATKTSCDNITRFPHLCRCARSRCSIVQYGWRSASSRVLQLFSEQQPGVCSRFTHPTRQCLCHVIMILDKPFSSQACHFSILFPLFLCCFYVLSPFASPLIFDKSSICLIINQYHSEGRREA